MILHDSSDNKVTDNHHQNEDLEEQKKQRRSCPKEDSFVLFWALKGDYKDFFRVTPLHSSRTYLLKANIFLF